MVHETKLLTFWRQLNLELVNRGASPTTLDVAAEFEESGQFTPAEVADVLAIPAQRYARDFDAIFGEG